MNWFYSISFKKKLILGCYTIVLLSSAAILWLTLQAGAPMSYGILTIVGLVILSLPIIFLLEKALTEPIDNISRIAMNIAKGDFTQKVNVSTNDALGELGLSFNKMIDKLRDILLETTTISKHVSETTRDTYYKNQTVKEALGQVTISASELASGASQISEEVANVSTSIKDIETKVSNYAKSTMEMNEKSDQMVQLVEQGRKAVETQGEGMKRNVEATSIVSATIDHLAKQANGISQITRSISEIAEQTNLLSLNASIEAARAGEHGKGFAVVAQEVRKLAEQSTTSTNEVFNLVRSIETSIQEALQNIEANEEIVQVQTELIRETEQIFAQIVHSVQFITQQIYRFAQESDTMLESAQTIAETVENISSITQESAAGTQQVSAAMNEQISTVEDMVKQSEKMTQMVSQLQRTIEIFKI